MSDIYYVYAYIRRTTSINGPAGSPYYIGKGKGRRAYLKHSITKKPTGKEFIIKIYDNLTEEQALDIEKHLISLFGRIDIGTGILRNLTDGGEGLAGRIVPESTRRKISTSRRGYKYSTEQNLANSLRQKGKPWSAARRAAEINKKPRKKRTLSEETKQKLRRPKTEETKRKMSNASKGKPKSNEHRKNMSLAHCRRLGILT